MKDKPKMLTPKLRFPEFQEEWRESPLGTVVKEFQAKSTTQGEYEVLTSARVGLMRQVDYYGEGRITERDNVGFNVIPADYLTYRSRTDDGRFYFNHNDLGITGIVSVYYPVFHSTNGSNAFFATLLNRFSAEIGTHSVGTSQRVLPISKLLQVRLPIPVAAEQRKIAACLTSLDKRIAAEEKKLEALRAHKKGLMQQLFPREGETRPRLRFPEFRDGPTWTPHPLDKFVVRSFYGTSNSTSAKGRYPVLRMGNMVDGGLDVSKLVYIDLDDEEFESIRLMDGDILLNRTNSMDLVGKISIFRLPGNYISASYIVTYRLDADRLDPQFCNLMLNTPQYQKQIKALARPSVSQANINPTTFRKELMISVPPLLAEQQRIAACFSWLDALIAAQSRKVDGLRTHKMGLMQQLFPSPEGG